LYDAVNHGRISITRLRRSLAGLPLPRAADGRLVLAVDVSSWLRPGAATSPERLFCHVYGRGKGQAQMIPGWPYSVVAALEPGRTSWTAVLDAVRLGPGDDEAADLRHPWERPAPPGRLTPARVRRGFRNIRATMPCLAGAPKPGKPGPGRPPGSKNRHPAPRHDVGKTTTRQRTLKARRERAG
jgi:hypothetical protein